MLELLQRSSQEDGEGRCGIAPHAPSDPGVNVGQDKDCGRCRHALPRTSDRGDGEGHCGNELPDQGGAAEERREFALQQKSGRGQDGDRKIAGGVCTSSR